MRIAVTIASLLVSAKIARAELQTGGVVGGRVTHLAGDVPSDPAPKPAIAAVVGWRISSLWSIATEPGIRWAGSTKYALTYVALPVLALAHYPLTSRFRLRATGGLVASYLARALLAEPGDSEHADESIKQHLEAWALDITAGIGVEYRGSDTTAYFVDLRAARGLASIHDSAPGLHVVNQEIGLWAGLAR